MESVPDEIDDVISEVFLALCKKVNESGMPEDPRAWLYKTLSNRIARKFKDIYAHRQRTVDVAEIEDVFPSDGNFVEELETRTFLEELRARCFAELSEDDMKLIECVYTLDMSMKEVAHIFKISEFAAKQRCYRLRDRLRKIARDIR